MEHNPNRREFLKKAALTAGAIAAGGVLINGVMEAEKERRESIRHAKVGVVRKELSNDMRLVMPDGQNVSAVPTPKWELVVLFNGKEEKLRITKSQFDSLKAGDTVEVIYEAGRQGPENFKLVNE